MDNAPQPLGHLGQFIRRSRHFLHRNCHLMGGGSVAGQILPIRLPLAISAMVRANSSALAASSALPEAACSAYFRTSSTTARREAL